MTGSVCAKVGVKTSAVVVAEQSVSKVYLLDGKIAHCEKNRPRPVNSAYRKMYPLEWVGDECTMYIVKRTNP